MHYLTLITAEIPALAEDEQKNKVIADLISKLEQEKEQSSQSPLCLQNIVLEKYRNMRDTLTEWWSDLITCPTPRAWDVPDTITMTALPSNLRMTCMKPSSVPSNGRQDVPVRLPR